MLPALLAVAFVAMAGCMGGNIPGQLGATHTGDLSNQPAERTTGHALLTQSCAPNPATGAVDVGIPPLMSFVRQPYLQRTNASGARVMFVADAAVTPTVTITTPEGAIVGEAMAEDTRALLPAGNTQWMAPLAGLTADTVYCYQVRSGATVSPRAAFRTAPADADQQRPVRFIAFGDSGSGGEDQRSLLTQLTTVPFDFIVHTGDIAYGSGTRAEFDQNFFQMYAGLLGNLPVFPTSGNHDYGTEGGAPYREVFDLPDNGGPDGLERWYSFNWGNVHFVALDTERTGSTQAAWLEADLSANTLPWTVVFAHRPPFSAGEHGSDGAFRQYFSPILEKHRVPLVLNGHDHNYERTTPQNGVTYVVTGGGGVGVRTMGSAGFTAFSIPVIHFVYIAVVGNQLELHAIDGLGQEFDSLVLQR